jgi:hypothetical protein
VFPLSGFGNHGHPEAGQIVYKGRSEKKKNILGLPAHIKIITGAQNHDPSKSLRDGIIDADGDDEKNSKWKGMENHVCRYDSKGTG